MGYALLFSGQGTQHPQMLPWIDAAPAAQPVLRVLEECLGGNWRALLADDTCRASNALAQPLIVGTALAAWAALRPLLAQPPQVVAGYSIGEVAACAAAGAFTPEQAIPLARQRASLMDAAVAGVDTGLLAISAVPEADVLAQCPGLECAIRIAADNNLFGGTRAALAQAEEALRGRATIKRICVALASHTSWMRSATLAFGKLLETSPLQPLECPVALNATGTTTRSTRVLQPALAAQLSQCVQWDSCMAAVAERQPACWRSAAARRSPACGLRATRRSRPARSMTSAAPRARRTGSRGRCDRSVGSVLLGTEGPAPGLAGAGGSVRGRTERATLAKKLLAIDSLGQLGHVACAHTAGSAVVLPRVHDPDDLLDEG
jgi:[acyl-carrier-protein] S-malonyltransferase